MALWLIRPWLDGHMQLDNLYKHRILFSSIQYLAWLPEGRQGNENVVKIAIFGLTHWIKHRITRKLLKIDSTCCDGFGKHWIVFPSMQHIEWGASPEKTKMKAGVRENDDFFAIVVRITGKTVVDKH